MDENHTPNNTENTNTNPTFSEGNRYAEQNQAPYNSAPLNNTPYGSTPEYRNPAPPYNNGAAYNNGANTPGGYNTDSYEKKTYSAPQTGNGYNAPDYNYNTPNQYNAKTEKKGKRGKSLFAILICICIVIASVAIGITVSEGNSKKPTQNSGQTGDAGNNATGGSADLELEDSPITFSEYSGKGAMTPEQIYKTVKEINVGVIVYSQNQQSGEGSGIIVGEDKTGKLTYILTAAHVIAGNGTGVQIQLHDGTEIDAEIVGYDSKTDVGVLSVEKTGLPKATFGNSDKLSVGQTIYAVGNPGGTEFFGSFTNGIISAIDRPIASTSSSYDLPCIQHNAAINPGNSGGALVNEYGQVIGLNSSKISDTEYEGMGFSVPSNTVLEIFNEIVAHGYVTNRPMLGITYYAVSSDYTYSAIAWRNDLPYGSIVIASMDESSDLKNQGIQVGDIITAVNGKALDSTDVLLETIENSNVGDKLTLSVCRLSNNGSISSKFDATITLVEDKGNTQSQTETTTDAFSNFFPFGY